MTAVYPGSFDPVTLGHVDMIRRAAGLCDRLIVAVLENKSKIPLFTLEERMSMLRNELEDFPNVEIRAFDGFAVEFAKACEAELMIRGVRDSMDFTAELRLAQTNRLLAPDIDTVLLPCSLNFSLVSSSAAKEIAMFGGDLSGFVSTEVGNKLKEKYRR